MRNPEARIQKLEDMRRGLVPEGLDEEGEMEEVGPLI
jgi:hypothetical protein